MEQFYSLIFFNKKPVNGKKTSTMVYLALIFVNSTPTNQHTMNMSSMKL